MTEIQYTSIEEAVTDNVLDVQEYIFLRLSLHDSYSSVLAYRDILEKLMKKFDVEPQITTNLKGSYAKELSLQEKNEITDEILKHIQGKVIIEHRSDDLFTVYAYSSLIPEYEVSNRKKINISINFSYDENEGKTYLYLATPIMNEDF